MSATDGFEAWFAADRTEVAELFHEFGDAIADGAVRWDVVEIPVPETVDVAVECEPEDVRRYELELTVGWAAVDPGTGPAVPAATADIAGAGDDHAMAAGDAASTAGREAAAEAGGVTAGDHETDGADDQPVDDVRAAGRRRRRPQPPSGTVDSGRPPSGRGPSGPSVEAGAVALGDARRGRRASPSKRPSRSPPM